MNALAQQDFYLDSSQYSDLKKEVRQNNEAANTTALQQFESLFISQMLKEMRSAAIIDESQHSQTMDFYTDMYDKQLATIMAKQGGIGIAKQLQEQLAVDKSIQHKKDYTGGKFFPLNPEVAANHGMPLNSSEIGMVLKTDEDSKELKLPVFLTNRANRMAVVSNATAIALDSSNEVSNGITIAEEFHQIDNNVDNSVVELRPLNKTDASSSALLDEKIQAHHGWSKPSEFIQELMPHAESVAKQLGVNPEVLVAQSALETGWGKHTMRHQDGSVSFSLFGIKADHRWSGDTVEVPTMEFRNGRMQQEKAHFRAYDSVGEAIQDYADFIQGNARYQDALSNSQDEVHYTKGLQEAGYATDPAYANKILNILQSDTLKEGLAAIETHREVA